MILGYLDNDIKKEKLDEMHKIGIKNIIYISNFVNNWVMKLKNMVPIFCVFQKLFFQFIHNFISILFSKKNNIYINMAFKEAKRNFHKSFKYIFQNYNVDLNIPNIEINMDDEDETFEFEYLEDESIETSNKENKNYNDEDENYYEDRRRKNESIYYMKNPFTEKKEIRKDYVRTVNQKYIKLPGLEYMNKDNLIRFINGGIYEISKFKEVVDLIETKVNTNIFYIYGKLIFKIGQDICKYFYMEKKFKNGIYFIKTINDIEEFESFIDSKKIIKNDSKLIVFDQISDQDKIFNDKIIEKMNKINNTIFIICSKVQEIKNKEIKFFEFVSKDKDENLMNINKEYILIQSIINNINIKN